MWVIRYPVGQRRNICTHLYSCTHRGTPSARTRLATTRHRSRAAPEVTDGALTTMLPQGGSRGNGDVAAAIPPVTTSDNRQIQRDPPAELSYAVSEAALLRTNLPSVKSGIPQSPDRGKFRSRLRYVIPVDATCAQATFVRHHYARQLVARGEVGPWLALSLVVLRADALDVASRARTAPRTFSYPLAATPTRVPTSRRERHSATRP